MAAREKSPFIGTAVMGWRDGLGAINAMPAVAGLALIILLVIGVLNILLTPVPAPGATDVISIVVGIISGIVQAFVVAPLAIAIHRYVLLGEVTPGYALDPSNPRYMRFVGFAILVKLLLAAPSLVVALPTALPIYFLLLWPPNAAGVFGRIVFAIICTVLQIVSICTLAAAASHTFAALTDRLASPPGAAPA